MKALPALAMALPAISAPWVCTVVQPPAPPTVRAEGMAELLPDVIVNCTGGDSAISADFTVFLGTNITSRIIDADTGVSEAMLITDEPGPGPTFATINGNQAIFHGVPLLPGSPRRFRIANLRANVAAFGGCRECGNLVAELQISGIPVANPVVTLGFIQNGLSTSLREVCIPGADPAPVAALQFNENFAGAFKTRTGANSESGFVYPGFAENDPVAGLAD